MAPNPSVLISLRDAHRSDAALRDQLETWVGGCGFRTRFAADAREALSWIREETFAASFFDTGLERLQGQTVWRVARPYVGRRLVLIARERRNDLWFEALRTGVGTVLPYPPMEAMVRAALVAVTGAPSSSGLARWDRNEPDPDRPASGRPDSGPTDLG